MEKLRQGSDPVAGRLVRGALMMCLVASIAHGLAGAEPAAGTPPQVRSAAELEQALSTLITAAYPQRTVHWEIARPHPFGRTDAFLLRAPETWVAGRNWCRLEPLDARASYLLPVDLAWEDSVWVASRALPARHPLVAGDVTYTLRWHTFAPAEVDCGRDPRGACLLTPLAAGAILTRAQLGSVPLVARGTMVSLVHRAPGLWIATRATALEDGAAGETIRVRPLSARESCRGVVLDSHQVEVIVP